MDGSELPGSAGNRHQSQEAGSLRPRGTPRPPSLTCPVAFQGPASVPSPRLAPCWVALGASCLGCVTASSLGCSLPHRLPWPCDGAATVSPALGQQETTLWPRRCRPALGCVVASPGPMCKRGGRQFVASSRGPLCVCVCVPMCPRVCVCVCLRVCRI